MGPRELIQYKDAVYQYRNFDHSQRYDGPGDAYKPKKDPINWTTERIKNGLSIKWDIRFLWQIRTNIYFLELHNMYENPNSEYKITYRVGHGDSFMTWFSFNHIMDK